MLQDLAEVISITTFRVQKNNTGKGRIKDFFKGGEYLKRGGGYIPSANYVNNHVKLPSFKHA